MIDVGIESVGYTEARAFSKIRQYLSDGEAVVLPNPSPLPYMVVSSSASRLNDVKRRSLDQNVASFIGDFSSVEKHLNLSENDLRSTSVSKFNYFGFINGLMQIYFEDPKRIEGRPFHQHLMELDLKGTCLI